MQYLTFVHQQSNYQYYNWAENVLRASVGFVAEYSEFKNSFTPDELGDCVFWWSILVAEFDYDPELNTEFNPINILDAIEKLTRVGQVSPPSDKVDKLVSVISKELSAFYWNYIHTSEFSLEEIQEMNRRKLLKRRQKNLVAVPQ